MGAGRPPLSSEGGKAAKITAKFPRELDTDMRAAIRQHDLTVSKFLRNATKAELARLDRVIKENATGPLGQAA